METLVLTVPTDNSGEDQLLHNFQDRSRYSPLFLLHFTNLSLFIVSNQSLLLTLHLLGFIKSLLDDSQPFKSFK